MCTPPSALIIFNFSILQSMIFVKLFSVFDKLAGPHDLLLYENGQQKSDKLKKSSKNNQKS